LQVQFELGAGERVAQRGAQLALAAAGAVMLGVENVIAVAPGALGQVHGLVSLAQQRIGVVLRARRERDADARVELAGDAIEVLRCRDYADQALEHSGAGAGILDACQQHRELVTAPTGDDVAGTYGVTQYPRELHQYPVAHGMTVALVDATKIVEIEITYGELLTMSSCRSHRARQVVDEQAAIGQLRERVVVRDLGEFLLRCFAPQAFRQSVTIVARVASGCDEQHQHEQHDEECERDAELVVDVREAKRERQGGGGDEQHRGGQLHGQGAHCSRAHAAHDEREESLVRDAVTIEQQEPRRAPQHTRERGAQQVEARPEGEISGAAVADAKTPEADQTHRCERDERGIPAIQVGIRGVAGEHALPCSVRRSDARRQRAA